MAIPAEEDKRVYHDRQPARLEALYETVATKADIASLGARIERNARQDRRRLAGFVFAIVSIGVAIIEWL